MPVVHRSSARDAKCPSRRLTQRRAGWACGPTGARGCDQSDNQERCLSRQLSFPVSRISQWWVSRSSSAVEPQAVARIAQSIERCGQIVPCIVVTIPGGAGTGADPRVLIDGYRRVAALRRLGRDTASVEQWTCDLTEALLGVLARTQDRRFASIEEALLLRELMQGQGLSQHDLARRSGRDVSWVSRRLALLSALPDAARRRATIRRRAQATLPVPRSPSNAPADARLTQPDQGAAQMPSCRSFGQFRPAGAAVTPRLVTIQVRVSGSCPVISATPPCGRRRTDASRDRSIIPAARSASPHAMGGVDGPGSTHCARATPSVRRASVPAGSSTSGNKIQPMPRCHPGKVLRRRGQASAGPIRIRPTMVQAAISTTGLASTSKVSWRSWIRLKKSRPPASDSTATPRARPSAAERVRRCARPRWLFLLPLEIARSHLDRLLQTVAASIRCPVPRGARV